MIPKMIHYCWFGGTEIPEHLQACIRTWQEHLPDYRIMRWDEGNFDVDAVPWTREAYAKGKYAFVADYVRFVALERYGGIYLDTDVMVKRSFDPLLGHPGFLGFENDSCLTSAVMGFEPHAPLVAAFMATYAGQHFINEDGSTNDRANVVMMTELCKGHGLVANNKAQTVAGVRILPKEYFCPLDFYHNDHTTEATMAVHLFDASWLDTQMKRRVLKERTGWHKLWSRILGTLRRIKRGEWK